MSSCSDKRMCWDRGKWSAVQQDHTRLLSDVGTHRKKAGEFHVRAQVGLGERGNAMNGSVSMLVH